MSHKREERERWMDKKRERKENRKRERESRFVSAYLHNSQFELCFHIFVVLWAVVLLYRDY